MTMKTKQSIYEPADIGNMSPITKKLDAMLKISGFKLIQARSTKGAHNRTANRAEYINSDGECIFINTLEPHRKTT